ncbi:hypothetical protein [Salinimicrobium oceani]|uniref:Uncharacterized protein n=1 Tax=Salinimicrobium oceani TaxID=2722702 RepID=A0ABX1D3A3_9FLAO|nr:hypothetical protein [Salinimicrobium oceani]NJW53168.1 hypothetical protein [Salinimicrobium oceani]
MKKILFLISFIIFGSCAEEKKETQQLYDYLPQNSAIILKVDDPDLFFTNLKNNEWIKTNSEAPLFKEIKEKTAVLKYFSQKHESLLALVPGKEAQTVDFAFITSGNIPSPVLDSLQNVQVESFTSDEFTVTKYILEGRTAFISTQESISVISNSRKLLEKSLRNKYIPSQDLITSFKAASAKKPSVFIHHNAAGMFLKNILPLSASSFSNWTVLDLDLSQTDLVLNGISLFTEEGPRLINVFEGTGTAKNSIATITPVNSRSFTAISFQNFPRLLQNLDSLRQDQPSDLPSEKAVLRSATEAGVINLEQGSVFAIHTTDLEAAKTALNRNLQTSETFREIDIFEYPDPESFHRLLQPLLNPEALHFLAFLEPYILLSKTPEGLKEIITAVQNELVLSETETYRNSAERLSSEASLLMVKNNQVSETIAPSGFEYEKFPLSAVQIIYQDDFAHVNSVLLQSTALKTEAPTAQQAAIDLGVGLASPPSFFKNHRSKGMDIAVQDLENTLYLISPEGKIYWKKQLESRILGKIETVDILRNGRYQLAFTTRNQLHVIDRDGNPVRPFPLDFKDEITQPLAIFDYENNRDYRFVIVQDDELFMYDRKATRVKGFDFTKAGSKIIQIPKHIRIGRKDYILIPESSGKLNILSRTGKTRVPVKEKIDFSENLWYNYKGNFVSSNAAGEILKISQEGKVQKEDIDLSKNHQLTASEELLVTLSEDQLSIKGTPVSLDFGLYTAPQLFYINNKYFIAMTDLQAHKVYVFDSNGALLPGFPVYGNSTVDLANADNDSALELVVQDEANAVLVYEIQ